MKDQLLQIKGFQFLILEELITDKLNGLAPYYSDNLLFNFNSSHFSS